MDYRKKMLKIEDCIEDFIQMEKTTREQMNTDEQNLYFVSKGMNAAYRYVVNRMVRDFEYEKERLSLEEQLERVRNRFQKLSKDNIEQSKVPLGETIKESDYRDDIPEEAIEEVNNLNEHFQQGMFEGIAFAYEQVGNYISIMLHHSTALTEKSITDLVQQIEQNHFANVAISETAESYQDGFANGAKSGFNMASWEIKDTFNT
ncbi:hypothetical protein JCM19037_4690 [Geomicrobium sp. JCM 19037]|uniref:hypothetical protein n=1 Tax=Geomicrobium sp. JCM 19037 TaxID=1460634 RepID=UPI00045F303B|nr:hypothetical protein [Geomicrobium sp. JCM 19037]GAK06117.1 hypothetical protein JCM19037_4690 [Geomicrobium sp. JCM 19037]